MLSGCIKQSHGPAKMHGSSKKAQQAVEIVRHYEACLTDVPVPLGVHLADGRQEVPLREATMMVAFASSKTVADIAAFYDREMERCGWQKACHVDSSLESVITFIKPDKVCTINLRVAVHKRVKPDSSTVIHIALGDNIIGA